MARMIRCGVVLPLTDFATARAVTEQAEALGFYAIAAEDHFFMTEFGHTRDEPRLEACPGRGLAGRPGPLPGAFHVREVCRIDLPCAPDALGGEPARADVAVDGHVMNAELVCDLR